MTLELQSSTQSNKLMLPGPPGLPIVGNLPFLGKYIHLTLFKLAKEYGNVFQIRLGTRTMVVLNGLEILTETLMKQQETFSARANFNTLGIPADGGLMEPKSGEPWRRHRGIAAKAMHTFVVSRSDLVERYLLEESAELANVFLNYGGQPFDPDMPMALAVGSIIHRLLFGKRGTPEDPDFVATATGLKDFPSATNVSMVTELVPTILAPAVRVLYRKSFQNFHNVLDSIDKLIFKNVEQHRGSFDPENLRDMTDAFLKAASELNESDRKNLGLSENDIIRGTVMQLTGAGSEPVLIQLLWAVLYMIAYPDVQAQIQQELDEVFGREQQPRSNYRGKLQFTEACINEILRHSSIIPFPLPQSTTTDTTINGYFIPKDTSLFANLYSLSRDERYWKQPEQFNPYRFLDANGKLRDDLLNKFYPFGLGPRRCLGEYLGRLEIFMFFTNLMHKFKFEKAPGEKLSFVPKPGFILRPQKYKVIVKPRL